MNRKIAAVLIAATMLTTPAFAASVASSTDAPKAQTVTPNKVTTTSSKGVKKHSVHARASRGHKLQHASVTSKVNPTSTSTKGDTKAVAGVPANAPAKN